MTTLAIDTATADTVVGAYAEAAPLAERLIGPGPDGRPRHGPALLPAVSDAVEAAGGWERIGLIAVGVGPGSFTGLRIGVATARAIAQARRLPVVGVASTSALAAGIDAPASRDRLAVIDARRGEVFAAVLRDGNERADAPIVCGPGALGRELGPLAGPLAAGEGAVRFRSELEAAGIEVLPDEDPVHRLPARHIAALAERVGAGAPEDVKPLYLRRPDAERWRRRDGRD